jgi:small GTP-binding protein
MSGIPNYKFIIVGSSGVGKTAILKRLVDDTFTDDSVSTIGVEFESTVLHVDGRKVKLQIWDTAGQERFRSIGKGYYRNSVGVVVVFDLSDRQTFDDLGQWMADIHALCDPNAVIQLIGNKTDLADRRAVSLQEAEDFAAHHRIRYMETSARMGANVRETFTQVAGALLAKRSDLPDAASPETAFLEGAGLSEPAKESGCC